MTGDSWLDILDGPDYTRQYWPEPASPWEIAALQAYAGRTLPEDYAAFLLRHDGGVL